MRVLALVLVGAFIGTVPAAPAAAQTSGFQSSYRSEATIRAPMLALSATRDDLVSQEAVESWRPRTAGGFTHRRLEGGHFMARDDAAAVANVVREAVAARLNQDLRPVEVA